MDKSLMIAKLLGIEYTIQRVYDRHLDTLAQYEKEQLSQAVETLTQVRYSLTNRTFSKSDLE